MKRFIGRSTRAVPDASSLNDTVLGNMLLGLCMMCPIQWRTLWHNMVSMLVVPVWGGGLVLPGKVQDFWRQRI